MKTDKILFKDVVEAFRCIVNDYDEAKKNKDLSALSKCYEETRSISRAINDSEVENEGRLKNYEKIREWINSLDKDEFIEFIKECTDWTCEDIQEKLGIKINCEKCRFYDDAGCYRNLMNADYESEGERYECDDY